MINNEELSRLTLDFKTLSEHPTDKLRLNSNGFLCTRDKEQTPDAKTIARIKKTYASINELLHYTPDKFLDTDIDFNLYSTLIHNVIDWLPTANISGIALEEKRKLLDTLSDCYASFEELERREAQAAEKKVEAASCEELFALDVASQKKPNFLIILTDEEKKLTGYEGKAVRQFHEKTLAGKKEIKANGVTLLDHRAASNACTPSRAALISGQFLTLTDMKYTGGVTSVNPPGSHDLSDEIPTFGSYFKAAGYSTQYVGKVHFCHKDIIVKGADGRLQGKITKAVNQPRDESAHAEYLEANPLAGYGLDGWVGREPHGSSPHDSAYNRDPDYTAQITDWLKERDAMDEERPFFAVVSLVNPHDIVYFPFAWLYFVYKYGFPMPGKGVTSLPINLPPTMSDNLDDRPFAQKEYRKQYATMFAGTFVNGSYNGPLKDYNPFNIWYQKTYLFFQQLVDKQIETIYNTLKQTAFYENTYVVLSTDHGEMAGAHGLLQKWLMTDREAVEIPCVISHPALKNKGMEYSGLTSHVDLLPTLLKLAGLNQDELLAELQQTHSEAHPLVGKPIGDPPPPSDIDNEWVQIQDRVLFVTADNPMNGEDKRSILAQLYNLPSFMVAKAEGIYSNTYIEMVEANLKINGRIKRYKYASYTPDPAETKVSNNYPLLEELFYDLTNDPYERKNLIKEAMLSITDEIALGKMRELLEEERKAKLIKPYDANYLANSQHHKQKIPREKPEYDFLFCLLTPPALLMLSLAYLAYQNSDLILKTLPSVALGLAAYGIYNQYQTRRTANPSRIEERPNPKFTEEPANLSSLQLN